jgi:hypothetical protein
MKITNLKITKPFWAIVKESDLHGYHTGKAFSNIALIEHDKRRTN